MFGALTTTLAKLIDGGCRDFRVGDAPNVYLSLGGVFAQATSVVMFGVLVVCTFCIDSFDTSDNIVRPGTVVVGLTGPT